MRGSGILLNFSCLPNEFGIGGFGNEALQAAKYFKSGGCKFWQVLPITTIGMGNSPYSGVSAFAGNALYIDPIRLYDAKLISAEELDQAKYKGSEHTVDFDFVKKSKRMVVKAAIKNLKDINSVQEFCKKNSHWISDYAQFMAIKETFDEKPWYVWEDGFKFRDAKTLENFSENNKALINYYIIEQYIFDMQWHQVKAEINLLGIDIIGDMPIYVSHDSADVWANPKNYLMDKKLNLKAIAGVPPDYFSEFGQLWGNPIYDYEVMAKDDYSWFLNRIGRMFELYDTLRLDHFRAFDRFWSVKPNAKDAREGEWVKGAGIKLFQLIEQKYPNAKIIAEDLGIIDDGVTKLRLQAKLPGMRVLQFGFDDYDSTNAPHNYSKDSVAYTGTHDNNTLFGWLYEIAPQCRKRLYDYIGAEDGLLGGANSPQIWACIRTIMVSHADTVIFPFQDLCGWGSDTRMNIPGVAENNWRIRVDLKAFSHVEWEKLSYLNSLSARS